MDRQYNDQKILNTVIRDGQDNIMTKRYQTQYSEDRHYYDQKMPNTVIREGHTIQWQNDTKHSNQRWTDNTMTKRYQKQ
jgi:hypothetical protein